MPPLLSGQFLQAPSPVTSLNVLEEQGLQGPPLGPVKAGLQMQSDTADEPEGELLFGGQALQSFDVPTTSWYQPGPHCMQQD
jgi:hypothetical protein